MTLKQAIETVRIALGDRNEHHTCCASRHKIKERCDCYAERIRVPHEAMDMIEEALKERAI